MKTQIQFDIRELERQLRQHNNFLLARCGDDGVWTTSYYMSRMDCSAEMKSDRESLGRHDFCYVLLEIRAIILPGEIYTGFER